MPRTFWILIWIFLFIISLTSFIYWIKKSQKIKQEILSEKNKTQEEWLKETKKKYANELACLENNISIKKQESNELDAEISQKKEFNSTLYKVREEELNKVFEEKEKKKKLELQLEVDEWAQSAQEAAEFQQSLIFNKLQKDIDAKGNELRGLQNKVNEYKAKRNAINEEILRARATEEKQDFYRIQISEDTRHDLELLNEIRLQFSKIEILDQLIYNAYIKKPVDEMIKRVLEGKSFSGIYKITRMKTGEIYIGKSTDIKNRWQQHCKTCYHCGTISNSTLHDTMRRDGIWNFTFELLEEVSKDKLTEREKYWINFYDSKNYGLNEKVG